MKESIKQQHVAPKSKRGSFTIEQYMVLKYRARGFTQKETADALSTTRSNISMIEARAKRKLRDARTTIRAYQSFLSTNSIVIQKGTRLQELPFLVLHEGDRRGVHIKSNVIQIIKLVKLFESKSIRSGKTSRHLRFVFNSQGKLSFLGRSSNITKK